MPRMGTLPAEGLALMDEPKEGCERCLIEFDVDTMLTVGDWLLCEDCYEDL